jgi:hypothetical protein
MYENGLCANRALPLVAASRAVMAVKDSIVSWYCYTDVLQK